MPGPVRKRKRQPRELVSPRKGDDQTAVVSEAAVTDEVEASRDDSTQARSKRHGANPGEYRPL